MLGCRNKHHNKMDETARDLPQIKDSGELVVLTLYSSTSYFIYRGQEMGFQYELSEQFAKSLGLKLRIEVANSVDEMIQKLLAGVERQSSLLWRRCNYSPGNCSARKRKTEAVERCNRTGRKRYIRKTREIL